MARLKASSLLEVMVALVLLMLCFLLFTGLVSRLDFLQEESSRLKVQAAMEQQFQKESKQNEKLIRTIEPYGKNIQLIEVKHPKYNSIKRRRSVLFGKKCC